MIDLSARKCLHGLARLTIAGMLLGSGSLAANAQLAATTDGAAPALLIFSERNDGGWSQALDEARDRMEGDLGVRIPVAEGVSETATAIRPAVELFIDRGANIILGSAFGYSDTFAELAEEYPQVAFLNPAGITNGDNLKSFYGRTYETHYLCGMVAGGLSQSGQLGFVAANPLGLVNWTINAYLLGAREVNPEATVTVVYTGAWADPVRERAASEALIEQGIDVVGQHVDTPTPQVVAQEAGIYATGHHRDLSEFSSATQCSSIWTWDRFLTPEIERIVAGEFEPAPYGAFLSIADGAVDIACCGDAVSDELEAQVMAAREALLAGTHVFTGPLMDREGTVRVAAGEVLDDGSLWGMDWYLEGVIAQ